MAYRYGSEESGFQKQSRVNPRRVLRQPWTDPDFGPLEAIDGQAASGLEWKRPNEIRPAPQLVINSRSRYDVGQGRAGTCWFLAAVSTIADRRELLDKVIPPENYSLDDGVFHARFWQFGDWEDVYVDTRLPVINGNVIWGAHSASDENEMWISLLEKAFAKFHGNYNKVEGGFPGDAYVQITGGVAETVQHKDITDKDQFYTRIDNAISSGCQVISDVMKHVDKALGLVEFHAYSMSGTATVLEERIVRMRNPWGKGEWKGRWCDRDPAWKGIPAGTIPHAKKDDGEFWMPYNDFMTLFDETAICSLTPDFDQDGCPDSLDYVEKIYGQWTGSTAAGYDDKLRNPKFLFTLQESEDSEPDPIVVQIIMQKREDREDERDEIRCDLFKIQGGTNDRQLLENMGVNTNTYSGASQRCFRFRLWAGDYCLVPSTRDPEIERKFLIRVFSATPLVGVRPMRGKKTLISCELQPSVKFSGIDYPLSSTRAKFGSWRSGVNSGGQFEHGHSHETNPQYYFKISKSVFTGTPVVLRVLQDRNLRRPLHIGLWLYSLDDDDRIPLTYEQIYAKRRLSKVLKTTDGEDNKCIRDFDFDATYLLQKGRYVLLVHTMEPDTEGDFTLLIKSTADVHIKEYQNGSERSGTHNMDTFSPPVSRFGTSCCPL